MTGSSNRRHHAWYHREFPLGLCSWIEMFTSLTMGRPPMRSGYKALFSYVAVFGVCAVVVVPNYCVHVRDSAVPHQDVYFNMWRMAWFAHAVTTRGVALWTANIFAGVPATFAMSDAIPMESLFALPLVLLHVSPIFVQNVSILGSMIVSAVAMAALAKHLTHSFGAGVLAGVVFAFSPYRIEHVMHLELQWAMWIPLTYLALHVTVERRIVVGGLLVGCGVALQLLSCVYYGVFLGTVLLIAGPLSFLDGGRNDKRAIIGSLAIGAVVASVVASLYSLPYRHAERIVGQRPTAEVAQYSASAVDYFAVPESNWLYGRWLSRFGSPERRLFPGAVAIVLALVGLTGRQSFGRRMFYLGVVLVAVELSFGSNGVAFAALRRVALPYEGLRAPSRFAILVLSGLSGLVAFGYVRVRTMFPRLPPMLLTTMLTAMMLCEYHSHLQVTPYRSGPSDVYRMLSHLPRGTVAEFPMPLPQTLPGNEAEYQYMSIFHWNRLVNGYSGTYPASYLHRLVNLAGFPDATAQSALRTADVRYVVVHLSLYPSDDAARLATALSHSSLRRIGSFSDGNGEALLYTF